MEMKAPAIKGWLNVTWLFIDPLLKHFEANNDKKLLHCIEKVHCTGAFSWISFSVYVCIEVNIVNDDTWSSW